MILGLIGMLAFLVGVIMLIISVFKKSTKKTPLLLMVVGFALLIVGLVTDTSDVSESETATLESKTEEVSSEVASSEASSTEVESSEMVSSEVMSSEIMSSEVMSSEEDTLTNNQQGVLDNINSFPIFIESYKNLDKNEKSPLWDDYIHENKVTWTGEVFEVAGDSLYVYGSDGYNGESWMDLTGEGNKAYNVFIADFDDPSVYEDVNVGDTVTITGSLDSRGDYDLNYNWKLYNSELE